MLCAALLRHEGCPQPGLGPLGRRFITGMSGRFLSTVHFPDRNPDRTHLSQAQRPTHRSVLRDSRVGDGRTAAFGPDIAIDVVAMGDPQYENCEFSVFHRVDDPVVADPDPPQVWISDERWSAARPRVEAQVY